MLEDFVSLVTEAVPQLLTDRQRSLLLLALRVKVTLSDPDANAIHAHLDKIRSVSEATVDQQVDEWCSALLTLADKLTQSPTDTQRLLQEVFDHSFDSALQSLISDFLSRMDQLFPVPDFKQAASWLDAAPGGLEDCLQEADRDNLRELLTNQSCLLGHVTTTGTTSLFPVSVHAILPDICFFFPQWVLTRRRSSSQPGPTPSSPN